MKFSAVELFPCSGGMAEGFRRAGITFDFAFDYSPPGWTFAGKTKRARWAQIGMAMPPPLAEAVARAVVAQMAAVKERVA